MSIRLRALLTLLVAPLVAGIATTAMAQDVAVGFQNIATPEGVEIGIWYPSQGQSVPVKLGLVRVSVVPGGPVDKGAHPLVVISHGTGGAFSSHADTAVALAKAGFIVAALTHPGDNWQDHTRVTHVEDRPMALSRLIDYMLTAWSGRSDIAARRIGAFGFSAGGFTVLTATGGRPDFTTIVAHCTRHPADYDCRLLDEHPRGEAWAWNFNADPRIKALVVAAPALGFTFAGNGLAAVHVPVQLWRADDDQILPAPDYADAVLKTLQRKPEFHHVPRAGHYDFLAPCDKGTIRFAEVCQSSLGFDRVTFHLHFNTAVVRFFKATL